MKGLQLVFFEAFVIVGMINLVHLGLYMIGANIYDMWQLIRHSKALKAPKKRGNRPTVTVLIPAFNEELSIVRCLESVRKNTYRKVRVIVIDDCSKDSTRDLVRNYIAAHPKTELELLARRKNGGKAAALNAALRAKVTGGLVMTLDADSMIEKHAIARAVSYFDGNPRIVGVAANVRIMENYSVLGLLQRIEHMIGYRSKKFYSLTNSEFIVGGVASTYQYNVMKEVGFYDNDTATEDIGLSIKIVGLGNKHYRIVYGSDVVAMTEAVQTFGALLKQRYRWKLGNLQNLFKYRDMIAEVDESYNRMLTVYRLPMAIISELILLLEPFLLSYVVYLSIIYRTPGLFIGAYLTVTTYVLWTVWPDEHSSLRRKLLASLYSPLMYFIFYIMDSVLVISIFRCLWNNSQITHHSHQDSAWQSPARAGHQQVEVV
jgi:biofilm PGA synthesis N-glycosyltransferase PgaC